jgi:hypothetical protein
MSVAASAVERVPGSRATAALSERVSDDEMRSLCSALAARTRRLAVPEACRIRTPTRT